VRRESLDSTPWLSALAFVWGRCDCCSSGFYYLRPLLVPRYIREPPRKALQVSCSITDWPWPSRDFFHITRVAWLLGEERDGLHSDEDETWSFYPRYLGVLIQKGVWRQCHLNNKTFGASSILRTMDDMTVPLESILRGRTWGKNITGSFAEHEFRRSENLCAHVSCKPQPPPPRCQPGFHMKNRLGSW
jgi:hypothetical protein